MQKQHKVEYLYANEGRENGYFVKNPVKGDIQDSHPKAAFVVFKVQNEDSWEGELQARTVAKKYGLTLAGGMFREQGKPYNFKDNYYVINVPKSTKPSEPTEHDRFIEGIIDYEGGKMSNSQEKKFLKKNKDTLVKLQGHYGRRLKSEGMM